MIDVKERVRAKIYRDNFNLSIEEWEIVNTFQRGLCFICGEAQKSGKRLNTDHAHTLKSIIGNAIPGQFRGLLCARCNGTFGKIERARWTVDMLKKLIEYILNPPAVTALGYPVIGFAGKCGTKRHRAALRKAAKEKK